MTRALALAALAGCAGGVEVIVEPPASNEPADRAIASVRLYVASSAIGSESLTPANEPPPGFPGQMYALDPASGLEVSAAPPVRFSLEGGTSSKLERLVAVAFASDGTPVAAISGNAPDIPSNGIDAVRLQLDAADALPLASAATREDRVQVWDGDSGGTCVYNASAATDLDYSTFVVGSDDFDCDGFANTDAKECMPLVYNGTRPPSSLDEITCALGITTGMVTCELAGPPCVDGQGSTAGCVASPYCVPATACHTCAQAGVADGPALLACLRDMAGMDAMSFAHVGLSYGGTTSGVGDYTPCAGTPLSVPLFPMAVACTTSSNGVRVWDASSQQWDNSLHSQGLTFDFSVSSTCTVDVHVSGTAQVANVTPSSIATLLVVDLAEPVPDNHGLAVPVLIGFESPNGCTSTTNTAMPPMYSLSDGLGSPISTLGCLDAPLAPGTGVQPFN